MKKKIDNQIFSLQRLVGCYRPSSIYSPLPKLHFPFMAGQKWNTPQLRSTNNLAFSYMWISIDDYSHSTFAACIQASITHFPLKHSVYNERKLQCATIYRFRARIFVTQMLLLWYPVFSYLWSQLCFSLNLWRILLLTERKVPLTSMVYSVCGFSKIIASWTSYWWNNNRH